ncbi:MULTISPECIES: hypothetical protein [unclassified Thiocapsa]|uniref:hypothetical protein n=1 Tax=unclassified Thiocapsa TaxID=2641286 RepID=UPI0035B479A9
MRSIDPLTDEAAVFQRLEATIQGGGCAVWVGNTVADAMAAWQTWNANHPDAQATLFHARFALGDRLEIAETIKHRFGPDSSAATRGGRLVVATQVFEQSFADSRASAAAMCSACSKSHRIPCGTIRGGE